MGIIYHTLEISGKLMEVVERILVREIRYFFLLLQFKFDQAY